MINLSIVIPCFNEAKSLPKLVIDFSKKLKRRDVELILVNNGSNDSSETILLNLKKNLGSQRALAVGLKYLYIAEKKTNIILMDADAEDDPNLLKKIIDFSKEFPNKIITINRTKRDEKLIFRFMYEIHYLFTLLITGKKIRFGNYSVICSDKLKKLFSSGDLWGAYSAAIINNYTDIKPLFYERS